MAWIPILALLCGCYSSSGDDEPGRDGEPDPRPDRDSGDHGLDGGADGGSPVPDGGSAEDAAIRIDFVERASACDGRRCDGPNIVQGGTEVDFGCRDLSNPLEVGTFVTNCGPSAIDQEITVAVRFGDPTGRDIAVFRVPSGMPPDMAAFISISIPWIEWRPQDEGTAVYVILDAAGVVAECDEQDNVVLGATLACE